MFSEMLLQCPVHTFNIQDKEKFSEFLRMQFGIMAATTNLMLVALQQAYRIPLRVREYYERHLEEEQDHCAWLEQDMRVLGITPNNLDHEIASLVGAQYYYIFHDTPTMLLGYMAALECRQTSLEVVGQLEALYGPQAIRTIRVHAVEDQKHSRDLDELLVTLPEPLQARLLYNTVCTARFLNSVMQRRL
jgi:hypothetical protein